MKKISEIIAPILFFNFKTAISLKSETNVKVSVSSETRLKVSIFTRASIPRESGLRWNDQARVRKGTEKGQSRRTSPFEGRKETDESEQVPFVGSRLFEYRISHELVHLNLGKTVEIMWLSEGSGKDILLSSLYVTGSHKSSSKA